MFGLPGGSEVFVVAFIALLLFGHRLPSVMRSLGRGVTEFKRGVAGEGEDELEDGRETSDDESKS